MKKALLVLAAVAMGASAFAQGTIVFANRNIPIASGGTTGGGNGNGTYNVPIWEVNTTSNGAGDLPGGVTVGIFAAGAADTATPLATTLLRTDANSQFFATGSQTVTIPGSDAGTTPTLLVRAWQGSGGYAAAKPSLQYNEWSFTTKPLGGTPASGGLPITPPSMTGWGPEDGTGLELNLAPEPSTIALGALGLGALFLRRRK